MKKITAVLFFCVVSMVSVAQTRYFGDVNNDGEITMSDANALVNQFLSGEKPVEGLHHGHVFVDLGLDVKWATCNIGANVPEDYGDYFAWGETKPKTDYSWSTYKWGDKDSGFTKYNGGKNICLEDGDDAAAANWGGNWRMPTKEEVVELLSECFWRHYEAGNTEFNGVAGYKIIGPNGNFIFLPDAGYYSGSELKDKGRKGYYWSALLSSIYSRACYMIQNFNESLFLEDRCCGMPVRAVFSE